MIFNEFTKQPKKQVFWFDDRLDFLVTFFVIKTASSVACLFLGKLFSIFKFLDSALPAFLLTFSHCRKSKQKV